MLTFADLLTIRRQVHLTVWAFSTDSLFLFYLLPNFKLTKGRFPMRPQNYVCVLVISSGIALISSFIFFLELFH